MVTGAGSGIGRATALLLAAEGCRVVAADIDAAAAGATAVKGASRGAAVHPYPVDVASAEAMSAFAAAVRREHGVADIVVNNAGIGLAGRLLDTTPEDWQRVLGVNLWGVIHGCRLFGTQMVERAAGGHIVNVASAAAFHPSRILPAYATTKAAVLMLSECLRAELAPHRIGVSVICPGLVDTDIVRTTRYVGAGAEGRRGAALRLYAWRGYGPDRAAARILAAVRRNQAVVPVTAEAHVLRLVGRLLPGLARTLARFELAPLP